MKVQEKIKVAVLYGGQCPEHEVSLASAQNIINNLDLSLFSVLPVKIDKQGSWLIDSVEDNNCDFLGALLSKSHRVCDVVLPMVHGNLGEDGSIQGLLELAQVPYVGAKVLASALGMDKDVSRRLVSHAGIQVVPYFLVNYHQWQQDCQAVLSKASSEFKLPLFVKPVNQGSSIGVSKVSRLTDLVDAISLAFRYDDKILIEQAIDPITEVETCLLEDLEDGQLPFVSMVGEIKTAQEYYTYDAKYTPGGVEIIIPASTPLHINKDIMRLAQQIFSLLGTSGMARIDFFVSSDTQQIYFNEINTLPGFTVTSGYPLIMQASGMELKEVLRRLIMLALKHFSRKNAKEKHYHPY